MMFKFAGRSLALVALCVVWSVRADDAATGEAKIAPPNLVPGPNDGRIAYVAARMLEANQYRQMAFDDHVSEKFYDGYLDTLDGSHLLFTQGDLEEWDKYRETLDDLTLKAHGVGDTTPAFRIFNRYFERLEQRVAYVDELLKEPRNFDFSTDERILLNRKDESRPKDLAEAKQLWRERLRFEYLQEKLSRAGAKKKHESASPVAGENSTPPTLTANSTTEAPAKKKSDAEEIVDLLSKRYHRTLRFFKEWDNNDVMQVYLTALAHIYDPHSDYFNASGSDNFAIGMSLSLFGIGAQLKSEDGYCTIDKLLPGGPAAKSGKIKEKDRLMAVAQGDGPFVDIVDMSLNKAVQLIRGPKGTEVRLVVVPSNDTTDRRTISLVRDEIKLEDQEAKARIIDVPTGKSKARLGVIDLPSFYATVDLTGERGNSEHKSSTTDVSRLLKKLEQEKVDGVILDLRRNGGGSLEEAVNLTGLFIKSGPVVQVKGPGADSPPFVDEDHDGGKILYDGPLIVLTSRGTASASEIVAGALQDYGRALIVGDISTHGKGTVQNLNRLAPFVKPATATATNDPGTLKLTIRKFYRAGGASTQLKGVMPDIVLPSVLNYAKDIGESSMDNALEWDTVRSAKFDRVNMTAPFLAELLHRANERIATNQDFVYVREDIEKFRARQDDKTISLNEQARLKEKEEDDARQKAREKELRARPASDTKVYELTLRQVDLPGLPPAVEKTNAVASKAAAPAAGFSTNSASIGPRALPRETNVDSEDDEDKPPAVDVTLDEAEHIMLDYIALMSQKGLASVAH